MDVDWSTVAGGGSVAGGTAVAAVAAGFTSGASGDEVSKFQRLLMARDSKALPKFGADGDYGDETIDAVKNFQTILNVEATGIIDTVTATLLEGGLSKGATGRAVVVFQERLLALKADSLPKFGADGDYGDETVDAVKKFQQNRDLPVMGEIDPATASALTAG
ncbi:MAG: peptidoglycan hydrolase-like protein with peptidoglycan-binding domain [Acidimicrobiales bacterium]